MPAVRCQICGVVPSDGDTCAVAIIVPTKDYSGHPLEVPGVRFACKSCRQALAVAEREQKKQRKEKEVPP